MKIAEDFRGIARDTLRNKWTTAVFAGIVASILGASGTNGLEFKINTDGANTNFGINFAGWNIFSGDGGIDSEIGAFIAGGLGIIMIMAILVGIIYFVLGSFVGVGYAKYNLNLADRQNASFENLFGYFSYWKVAAVSRLLRTVYVMLWSLLLIIPGVVASFSYAMTDYILAENTNLTASEAIEQSKAMMDGNKWRFFCLQFSFIGWDILATLVFGIGHLWLTPYKQAAYAAFYREISGTERMENEYVFDIN